MSIVYTLGYEVILSLKNLIKFYFQKAIKTHKFHQFLRKNILRIKFVNFLKPKYVDSACEQHNIWYTLLYIYYI